MKKAIFTLISATSFTYAGLALLMYALEAITPLGFVTRTAIGLGVCVYAGIKADNC